MSNTNELAKALQALMHHYGVQNFTEALIRATYRAADDTEDFEDKKLTQQYRYLANEIQYSLGEMPRFNNNEIED